MDKPIYSNIDIKRKQYASKGDRIQFTNGTQVYQAAVESATINGVIVTLSTPRKQTIELKHGTFQIIERSQNANMNIAIEIGDLISFIADGTSYMGIIRGVDVVNAIAEVDVISNNKVVTLHPTLSKLFYIAKGYTPLSAIPSNGQTMQQVQMQQVQAGQPAQVGIQGVQNVQPISGVPVQMNTSQNPSQIALLYPAPCVVMAVPYNTNPDSFPEAMYVQIPDRNAGQPTLLPVVRMGCDTALVVIPPNKSRPAQVVPTQVKATPATRGNMST